MPKPKCDYCSIHARLQQFHRHGVPTMSLTT
jgi:hypothetical protein